MVMLYNHLGTNSHWVYAEHMIKKMQFCYVGISCLKMMVFTFQIFSTILLLLYRLNLKMINFMIMA